MKLIKCYVSSFGKLQDYTYDFCDGLNTIKEDNGFGKSTLATFIKAVFYGLNGSKRSVAENERVKYRPWNSVGTFGGYIEFEWGGQNFKLERFFGNKESEDSVKLYDLKTGRVHENPEDIGRRIFEIDEDGFLSTTYFSQRDFQIKSNTSLTAKFNSVCEIQDSETFDKALNKIEEKAKTYKYRGDKGLVADNKQQIYNINEKIEDANKAILTASSFKVRCDALEKETNELKEKLSAISKQETLANQSKLNSFKKEQYEKLASEIDSLNTAKMRAEAVLNGHTVTQNETNAYLSCVKEIDNLNYREQSIKADLEQFEVPVVEQKKKSKLPIILGLTSGACLVVAVILAVVLGFLAIPSIALYVLTFLVGIGALITLFVGGKEEQKPDNRYQEILQNKRQELNEYQNIKGEYLAKINSFIARFNLSQTEDKRLAIEEISKVSLEYEQIVKSLNQATTEINKYTQDKSFLTAENVSVNLDSIVREKSRLQEEYDARKDELAKCRSNFMYYEELSAVLPELEAQKIRLAEKQAQYKEDYELLTLTAEYLKKADENLKVKYRAPLQESLNKYLKLIAGEKVSANIDIDLTVTIEENGSEKVTDYYSKGYQNLFEICKRFALTSVLFKGEKPFIILDDPFYNLDDEKLRQALQLIDKLSQEYQIVYFVCHESRRPNV